MPVRLFVGNLSYNVTEAELREHFSAAGEVSYISLPTDRETGQLRGFAFVDFNDRAQAEDAINRFNNQSFKGRTIAVSVAREREDRPPGGGSTRPSGPRPNTPRLSLNAEPESVRAPASGSRQNRDFGPDAPPQKTQRNKKKSGPRPERGPKGPMREMSRGQFYGGYDDVDDFDDEVEDFYEDADDFHEEDREEETNEQHLANRLSDKTGENN